MDAPIIHMALPEYESLCRIVSAKEIMGHTVDVFGLNGMGDLTTQRRSARLVRARFAAMYVIHQKTNHSYPSVGRLFGDRDHTTVMYAVRRAKSLMAEDDQFRERVMRIIRRVEGREDG